MREGETAEGAERFWESHAVTKTKKKREKEKSDIPKAKTLEEGNRECRTQQQPVLKGASG